jgi:hypothetical protein
VSFQYVALQGDRPRGTRINQRATVRYQCAPATPGRVVLAEDHEFQRAWIQDLSTRGIGLCMSRPLKTGTFLAIQLKSASQNRTYELTGTVIHATALPAGDFLVGCEFLTHISAEDLEALL